MISYQEALEIISQNTFKQTVEKINLSEATNRVLAEDIKADRALPPYDRVTMDGIAISYSAYAAGQRQFPIAETIGAGMPQKSFDAPEQCVQIMTGAIMPNGLDTIIRYEDLTISDEVATINVETVKEKQNIHFKASDKAAGDVVLTKGTKLSAAELIVAAAVGCAELPVYKLPKAAIITTGDELVAINETPLEHQVRRSSNYGVESLLNQWGIETQQFHLADDKALMLKEIEQILKDFDVLVLTGGVSRGKFDYLPEVLKELGVTKHFHKVKQRPGKPFWFGTSDAGKQVFALPGNPVSSFVCANIYIRYWLNTSLSQKPNTTYVKLQQDLGFPPPLTYFLECKLTTTKQGELMAETFKGNGSGDFANLTQADGFIILPDNQSAFKAGEVYPYIPFR
ncbi:molybdopterin molybdotransferase MoeA [Roseivirga pacifica]|uniref:molybdopterin molybdotransferase MoeA n=1 Tax=Roseivirga pacifica TaxID=1267423 RepID=UPI003BAB67AA